MLAKLNYSEDVPIAIKIAFTLKRKAGGAASKSCSGGCPQPRIVEQRQRECVGNSSPYRLFESRPI
jgi:hypothetical protein